ncbi:hypothetical protein DFH09DRAFT_1095503 [Mycena vulgaris]|nr:hypothetical protein DFH09DRAFT_1095503 [Mycena vulgaris]
MSVFANEDLVGAVNLEPELRASADVGGRGDRPRAGGVLPLPLGGRLARVLENFPTRIGFPVPIVLRSTSVGFPGRGESAKLNGDASPTKPTGRSERQMWDIPEDSNDPSDYEDGDEFGYNDVADGTVPIEISHGGGELGDLQDALNEAMNGKKQRKRHDSRKRWDSVERRVLGFRGQMRAMTDAYMKWAATQGEYGMESAPEPVDPDDIEKVYKVRAIDVFGTYIVNAPMRQSDEFTTSCLVGQGLIPCTPWTPKLAIATRVLEMFRVARLSVIPDSLSNIWRTTTRSAARM